MSDYDVSGRLALQGKHVSTGNTLQPVGGEVVGAPAILVAAKYPDDPGYYDFYAVEDERVITATAMTVVDVALDQPDFEFHIHPDE